MLLAEATPLAGGRTALGGRLPCMLLCLLACMPLVARRRCAACAALCLHAALRKLLHARPGGDLCETTAGEHRPCLCPQQHPLFCTPRAGGFMIESPATTIGRLVNSALENQTFV